MIGRRLPCLLAGLLWACGSAPDLPTGVGSVDDGPGGSSAGPSTRDGPAVTGGSTALGGSSSTPGGSSGAPQGGVAGLGADGPASIPPPMPVGCVTEVSPGVHHLTCDGLEHDLTIPEPCVAQSCGLVVDVHGGTMSGAMEDKNTNLSALGQQYGYVVITPTAPGGLWNAATDDPKILAFMTQVIEAFRIDRDRVHMTGMSQGGYMTWRFVCQHTDLFASVAPAAAAGAARISAEVGCTFTGSDVPSGEVDILYMHGTEDALVDFQNALVLRDAVIAHYGAGPGEGIAVDATYRRTRYPLPGGHVFELIDHDYVSDSAVGLPPLAGVALRGHCFPGSDDLTITLPGQLMAFGCNPPNSLTWGEEVIRFFREHPRR